MSASLGAVFTVAFVVWPRLDPAAAVVFEPRVFLVGHLAYGSLLGCGVLKARRKPTDVIAAF